jgi:hypothetical protein
MAGGVAAFWQPPRENIQKWLEIVGHIKQAERGAIHKTQQALKHFCPLLSTAMIFVSCGFVFASVQGTTPPEGIPLKGAL